MSTSRLTLSSLFLLTCFCSGQEKVLVRAHWDAGKKYTQQTETQTTSSLTPAPGKTVEQKLSMVQTTGIAVTTDTTPTHKRAQVTFEKVTGTLNFMGKIHTFDSKEPHSAHPVLRQALSGTAGKTFALIFDGEDRFVKTADIEKLSADGSNITGLAATADAQQIAGLFQQSLEIGLPKTPVAVGEQWTSEESLIFPQAGPMKVKIASNYAEEVMREGRKHARITFEGQISSETKPNESGERVATLREGSTIAGQVFFDMERRVISLSVFVSNMTLNLSGNTIPLRQQVTTRLLSITDIP